MRNLLRAVDESLFRIAINIFAFLCLGCSLLSSLGDHLTFTVVSFLSFLFLIFYANPERFSKVKAGPSGFEIEAAKTVVGKAEYVTDELRSLAKIVGSITLSLTVRAGRWDGYDHMEKERICSSVLEVLRKVGVPRAEYEDVLSDWRRMTEFDYVHGFLTFVSKQLSKDNMITHQFNLDKNELQEFRRGTTPQELREFLTNHKVDNMEVEELFLDVEYYFENGKHRRLAVWENWNELCH